ncbi:MAG TPA: sigma factor-like helix-turn-helix DNA-binding protein [Actinomycetota bacterium]|nr:sigma factor-like helix-turn-helix DNA-binding protein [Actinomycetota bacterium]
MLSGCWLSSPQDIVQALLRYTDWWQPFTTSVLEVAAARKGYAGDGIRPGLLETLDERTELQRRMQRIGERDRHILFLWYVKQLEVREIARILGISRRQCFRIRARAIRQLVEAGEAQRAAVGASS